MSNKLFVVLVLGVLAGIIFAGLGSAYYYNYMPYNDYSHRTYSSTWDRNGQVTVNNYDRYTSTRYLANGARQTVSTYTKVSTDSPQYGYYRDYGNYYGGPWYQKYWNTPTYGNYYPSYIANNYGSYRHNW